MPNLARPVFYLACVLTLAAPNLAQQDKRTRQPRRKSPPAPVREQVIISGPVAVLEESPREEKQVGKAKIIYEPKSDFTSVVANLPDVYRRGQVTVSLECSSGFKGRAARKPDDAYCSFLSGWGVFKGRERLTVVADGETLSFTPEPADFGNQRHVRLDFDSFEKIVNGKSVKMRIGQVAFALTESHREALRDMLRAFEAPSLKP